MEAAHKNPQQPAAPSLGEVTTRDPKKNAKGKGGNWNLKNNESFWSYILKDIP